jgi:hypothetical protein
MGAIFPMAPLKTRRGFVRKREREAKRAAKALVQAVAAAVDAERVPLLAGLPAPTDGREQ